MDDILTTYLPHAAILSSAVLADALDALGHRTSCLPHFIRPLNNDWKILGKAATLSCMPVASDPQEPYAIEMECIDLLQPGAVLIATTNGDRSSALWGELLSTACKARGAAGVIVDGLTRDAARILAMNFPVFAAGFSPLDSRGRIDGVCHGQPIRIGACLIQPGDYALADIDGITIVPQHLARQAFARALEKVTGENRVRAELAKGRSVREVFREYGIL